MKPRIKNPSALVPAIRHFKLLAALLWLSLSCFAQARTITLTLNDCDLFATISSQAAAHGWAGTHVHAHFSDSKIVNASGQEAILLRFKLDRIPKDQRIVRAELLLPLAPKVSSRNARLHLWRLQQPWGVGINHRFRSLRPEAAMWTEPGARGIGSDRASRPSVQMRLTNESGEIALNVLSDVELWHSGSAKEYGWMLCTEDLQEIVGFQAPLGVPDQWKLRITYEP